MIVRTRADIFGSERDIAWGNGDSARFLIREDGFPFSVTHTTVDAGSESNLCYRRHFEACYCIEGEGEVVAEPGVVHRLEPGVIYSVARGERHCLRALSDLHLICVFWPALEGHERHLLSGDLYSSY